MDELVYSTPKILHYKGCAEMHGYPCDCGSMVEEED